jgi:hypothetical protein
MPADVTGGPCWHNLRQYVTVKNEAQSNVLVCTKQMTNWPHHRVGPVGAVPPLVGQLDGHPSNRDILTVHV